MDDLRDAESGELHSLDDGSALGAIDDTIRATERIIEKLRSTRPVMLDQLITDLCARCSEAALAELSLDPICAGIVRVGAHTPTGVPVVALENLGGPYGVGLQRVAQGVEAPYARSRVEEGDLVVSIKGTIGRVAVIPAGFRGNISGDLARIRTSWRISPHFLSLFLSSDKGASRLRHVAGPSRTELPPRALQRVMVPVPPPTHQDRVVAVMTAIDDRMAAESAAADKLRLIRSGLAADRPSWSVKLSARIGPTGR